MAASIITELLISAFYSQPHITLTTTLGGDYFISILQMRELRISKMIRIPPGHIPSKQQSWGSTLNLSGSQTLAPILRLRCLSSQGKWDRSQLYGLGQWV